MKVAVDAMGGDSAPEVVIRGAVGYLKNNNDLSIVLVGKEKEIKKEFKKHKIDFPGNLEILNAHEKVLMRENFFSYWKKREKTSIKKALDLVKHKKAQAMISAGNTGAVMAIAKTVLGTLKRIERPALALMVPTLKGQSLLVDVGANVDSKPKNLVQFALMGKVFLESVIGIKNPRIALMSIGEEEAKGNELIKTTYNILKSMDINFVGNVEGRDVYIGVADLIVTDGFTGNVTLKVTEGVVDVMLSLLKREIMSSIVARLGFFLIKNSFKRIKKRMDYSEYGGALLLGVNGIVIIGHGGSSEKAIRSAIDLSKRFIKENVLDKISKEIERIHKQGRFKELSYG
ncbi:MAG: phosphate acyltransferase PlsX [Candidatus Aminicenantes bacterium]|nr:phosphate acyltransferase PlsX [Candidatus Aminicenantes bacterium]NIM83383.1 phosphate acyltransferase PlsX [Candidatus Aminicenantes bacterium]NIN22775.1 phosphate acyltransferase PlsX [Candidatus Aminicenantes bacterium]NIN46509.1 phosphate acyltransferase PlsX [Candidatus Aminicenantes bacterium]NIN89414.1 phosphate acyltransferase PlsX [Candidatus Aminicenantes bacterium]